MSDPINEKPFTCVNCGIKLTQDDAIFETEHGNFTPGFEFEGEIETDDIEAVFCTRCHHLLNEKNVRESDQSGI